MPPATPQFQHADLPDQYRLPLKIEIRLLKIILLHFRLLYRIICSPFHGFHFPRFLAFLNTSPDLSCYSILFRTSSVLQNQDSFLIYKYPLSLWLPFQSAIMRWTTTAKLQNSYQASPTLYLLKMVHTKRHQPIMTNALFIILYLVRFILLANFFFFSFLANRFIYPTTNLQYQ